MTAPRLAPSDSDPHVDQGAAAAQARPAGVRERWRCDPWLHHAAGRRRRARGVQRGDRSRPAALPEHYRAPIKWRLWEDLSFAEIDSRFAVSDDCAQKLYGRAIARLRELLGPRHDTGYDEPSAG